MEILQGENKFYVGNAASPDAEITFQRSGDAIVIDHTFTDPKLRGQGVAKALVERAVQYARDNNLKVTPLCSYARVVIERDPAMQSLIK
ncbi:GNAT family N-acetyltransferase [Macrococcus armenti]|uniref:GNAT family N-acetyltransferase n=1 Tax=Macrococcus armenti TaxID=2875764 RepID=UPI001CCD4F6C|nr:GNAT family N-acetyltransferase [Macrococcus armenti]UBH08252.1 N-acetyltransferase [Macrococcus armenti]UBH10483.1 N-acetyltransferase [Macrococcus armenti]UBH15031.1 N-acetyltransferase [Macrococcus armenti]UBH17391.1 N-acetyltransferase [Macrococcus armenti]UBH19656.1 N-acetyltransferase [Macrococcus armenti]